MQKLVSIVILLITGIITTMCSKDTNEPTTSTEEPGVTVAKITYNGWNDSYQITNPQTKVVVVPAIGRIMFYGNKNGKNLLWENSSFFGKILSPGQPYRENGSVTWANFGGDKVWPTEQDDFPIINDWGWPPDHWFDGGPHQVEEITNGVKITSLVSDFCGARSIREISLGAEGSTLSIKQTIEKIKRAKKSTVEPIRFTVWNVTQIRSPQMALFNLNPNSTLENGIYFFSNAARSSYTAFGNVGVFTPNPSTDQKAGADSDLWLAAIVENTVIGEFFSRQPGAEYPDSGLSAEVYTSSNYTELELLSPFDTLSLGEKIYYDITWRLYNLPSNVVTKDQKRQAAVDWLNSFSQ